MDIFETWIAEFRAFIDAEIVAAGGKPSDGYRAVATKTGIAYAYIYQIYKGKPKTAPKRATADVMNTMRRVYCSATAEKKEPDSWPFKKFSLEQYDKLSSDFKERIEYQILGRITEEQQDIVKNKAFG